MTEHEELSALIRDNLTVAKTMSDGYEAVMFADEEDLAALILAAGYRKQEPDEWEYVPGHRWMDSFGGEHWFVMAGTIAPGYVGDYIKEGGKVIRRKVGPWEEVLWNGEEEHDTEH